MWERNIKMQFWWSFLFLILSFVNCLASLNNELAPICGIEGCKCEGSNEKINVICSTIDPQIKIFEAAFWNDSKTHHLYPYDSVTIQDNKINSLNKTFQTSNLTYLNLANNDISGIGEGVFKNLQNMKVLILSYNDLEIIHPDAFKGIFIEGRTYPLKNLKKLLLDHNKLHTLDKDIFEHTRDIEILDLSFNPITIIDQNTLNAITSLPVLKELYLQYIQISTLPDTFLHTPKHLLTLDLSGNPIQKMPETFKLAHKLTNLYLNNTEFRNLTEANGFANISTLKVLHLCENEFLVHLGKRSLSGLTNLEELRICKNSALTEIDPFILAFPISHNGANVWPNIKKLHLHKNKLSYLDSDIVARWDELLELDIRDNPWTCECENQWLITDLMPIYLKINKDMAKEVICAAPIEMHNKYFYELYKEKMQMRCLDENDSPVENNSLVLIGIVAGVLVAIPITLILILGYQRKWYTLCSFCNNSPAAYSRRFYSTTRQEEDYT